MNSYNYEDIEIGHKEQFNMTVTKEMLDIFCNITTDCNPLHCSSEYARERGYEGRVCYGMLTASLLSTLAGVYLPGEKSLIHSVKINFMKPVLEGDRLTVIGTVKAKDDKFKFISINTEIFNQKNEKVLRGVMTTGVRDV